MKASAELLIEGIPQGAHDPKTRLIRNIARSADRLDALVADLLDVARAQTASLRLEKEPTEVVPILQEAVSLVQPIADERDQVIETNFPEESPVAPVDRRRIEQVVLNLLTNASKYTPAGGRLGITLREVGQAVVIVIKDTGPGIPEQETEHIFEPFYRVEGVAAPGTGLGLAIAKALVELHEGRIWVESSPGNGSTFAFTLPLGVAA
jgi:signal transduction histidine kinase